MARAPHKRLEWLSRGARVLGCLLFVYVGSYFLLMDPEWPAVDPAAFEFTSQSTYRFAPYAQLSSHPTIFAPTTCWANWVFWPIDAVVHPLLAHPLVEPNVGNTSATEAASAIERPLR